MQRIASIPTANWIITVATKLINVFMVQATETFLFVYGLVQICNGIFKHIVDGVAAGEATMLSGVAAWTCCCVITLLRAIVAELKKEKIDRES